jgi:hypothetical protein
MRRRIGADRGILSPRTAQASTTGLFQSSSRLAFLSKSYHCSPKGAINRVHEPLGGRKTSAPPVAFGPRDPGIPVLNAALSALSRRGKHRSSPHIVPPTGNGELIKKTHDPSSWAGRVHATSALATALPRQPLSGPPRWHRIGSQGNRPFDPRLSPGSCCSSPGPRPLQRGLQPLRLDQAQFRWPI